MTRDVRWLSQQLTMGLAKAASSEVTPTQMLVLAAASDLPGASQTQLTAATMVDRSTLADVVRRLKASGLIVRKRDKADARAYNVTLTPNGAALLKITLPKLVKVEHELSAQAKKLAAGW